MTIYDIAKEANVSASTVSRVINNKPGINKDTRNKVKELLKKYNYTPNIAARGLVTQASGIVGILIEDIRVIHHTSSVFYIERELTKRGYCCITMGTGLSNERKSEYIRLLEERSAQGVILMGSKFSSDMVKQSIIEYLPNIPIVIANGYLELPNVSSVIVDEKTGVKNCVDLLFSKGKRRICFVIDEYRPSNEKKLEGYIWGMTEHGVDEKDILVFEAGNDLQSGYDITNKIISEYKDIDGIIYSVDLIATGGIRAIHDANISIPNDISVIGIDNSVYGEICMPKLTTLDNKLQKMSEVAAKMLIQNLEGKNIEQLQVLETEIIEREST